jgi:D-alanyl-D-alanine carboxypeptidase
MEDPYLRRTTTPLRRSRKGARRAVLVGAAVVAVFLTAILLGMSRGQEDSSPPREDTSACLPPVCAAADARLVASVPTPGPTPCPYCNQDPNRWQSLTANPPPELAGKSAALIEGNCGVLLYGFDERSRRPPASLTKIVAAMVTTEHAKPSDTVLVNIDGWSLASDDDSTIMGLEKGMKLPVEDLLYGMMLVSGNDAALALAEHLGGNGRFVGYMNDKVKQLGLADTRFVTPDGRDAPGHYSSTFDMAVLGRTLLQDPYLTKVVNTRTYLPRWDRGEIRNNNEMIYVYPDATGVKTGYTETAEFTIVTAMERNGRLLVVSVFGAWHLYLDAWRLLNWGFDNTRSACGP